MIRRFLSLASEVVILTTWLNTAFASAPPTPAPGWSTTTSLPNGYYQQVFVYWNGFFYQAGGYISDNDNPSSDVLYAQVQTNMNMVAWTTNSTYGGLSYSISNNLVGTWNETTPLPDVVAFPAGVADRRISLRPIWLYQLLWPIPEQHSVLCADQLQWERWCVASNHPVAQPGMGFRFRLLERQNLHNRRRTSGQESTCISYYRFDRRGFRMLFAYIGPETMMPVASVVAGSGRCYHDVWP